MTISRGGGPLAFIKGAGFFKKLFRRIAKIFLVAVAAVFLGLLGAVVAVGLAFGKQIAKGIMKVSTALFGKTIGGAIGSVLAFPFSFLGNTAHLLGQGDFKGLFKFWGQSALQIAMTALMFIPGVGQALYAGLQFVLQPLLAIGKFLIGGILQGLGIAFSGMGSFIGSFAPGIGGFLKGVGGTLRSFGQSLVQSAKNFFNTGIKDIFAKLKSDTFSFQKAFSEFKKGILNQINPVTYYQNTWKGLTRGVNDLASKTGFSRFLGNVMEKVGVQIALQKIDKSLEKSKMSSFLKTLISTVSAAGIQAIGSTVTDDLFPPQQAPAEATRSRAPPTNQPGVFARILGNVGSVVTNALKDAAGFVKSIFIRESDTSLTPAFEDLFQEKLAELDFNSEGNPYRLRLTQDRARIEYAPAGERPAQGLYSFDLDQGNRQILRIDPTTKAVLSQERIGNLGASLPSLVESLKGAFSSFNEARYLFSDALNLGIDSGIDSLIGSPDGLPSWAYISSYTILYTAGDFIKGTADFISLGRDLPAIFSHLKQGFKSGELKQAALNYLFTGQPFSAETPNLFQAASLSLNELNRAFIAGSGVIGALRGVGNLSQVLKRTNLAGPGEDLFVGTYTKSRRANVRSGLNRTHTPHHVVQDAVSPTTREKGITINLRKDIHELTETMRRRRDLPGLRQHLAADIRELRRLLRDAGYDDATINAQLKELIRRNKQTGVFNK